MDYMCPKATTGLQRNLRRPRQGGSTSNVIGKLRLIDHPKVGPIDVKRAAALRHASFVCVSLCQREWNHAHSKK